MSDFTVESDNLRSQSTTWSTWKTNVDTARTNISTALGKGYEFGYMAGSFGVSGHYDEWISDMDNALMDAGYSFDYLSAALVSTANRYDSSDDTAATSIKDLDAKIEATGYHHD